MRVTITLSGDLVKNLLHHTHSKKASDAVIFAVKEWLRVSKINQIKKLCGKLEIDQNLKRLRQQEVKKIDDLNG